MRASVASRVVVVGVAERGVKSVVECGVSRGLA
jgi:hypothetical protein